MIFEVSPTQIQTLNPTELVLVLRRLLHAEAQNAGIDLRLVSVPLQINVPDGGEDGRISWTGGIEHTDYLPCRHCTFQSKASILGPGDWKKEVWTKASRKNNAKRRLSKAVTNAISKGGSYIGFTTAALVGTKYDDCVEGIREGIRLAAGNPDDLAAIDIYDANKIAGWCSQHPSVALWLNERKSGLALTGFQTVDGWGTQAELSTVVLVPDNAARYTLGGETVVAPAERRDPSRNSLNAQQAKERILHHLTQPGRCVRLSGPSGVGKTRFAYEIFKDISSVAKAVSSASAIYCDYRSIGQQQLFQTAHALAQAKSPALIVVDECPRESASHLGDIAGSEGSQLRLLVIDIDERPIKAQAWLDMRVEPSDEALIEAIIRQRLSSPDAFTVDYIKNLCGGFPRIAVLATTQAGNQAPVLKSIDDVVDRVLVGCGIKDRDQLRAIECLALFDRLAPDNEHSAPFDLVAERLAGLAGERMYEYIVEISNRHIVDRRGRYFLVQPTPISAYLGARRIDLLRVTTIMTFIEEASQNLRQAFFSQWRYFDMTRNGPEVAELLLSRDGMLGTLEALGTEPGARIFDALVHVVPDIATDTLQRVLTPLSLDELQALSQGRRYLVWALEKLVFRRESFAKAARLLMRLAAAENESFDNNASGQFKQLYQVRLSGTEATPAERFAVLDEGLASADDRTVQVCFQALETTLKSSHFSRAGSAEQIGSGPPRRDWHPTIWGDVYDFHREGIKRLDGLRDRGGALAAQCEKAIASHLRGLLCEALLKDLITVVQKIAGERGLWLDAIRSIGDWLYFDRRGVPEPFPSEIRALYDTLLPTDIVERAFLYTKFWSSEIRDPDRIYDQDAAVRDYDYSTRKACELAGDIATDAASLDRAIHEMAAQDLHNAFPFARELGSRLSNSGDTLRAAINVYESAAAPKSTQFIRGLLNGIDQKDTATGNACLQIALSSPALQPHAISLYAAILMTPARLLEVTQSLQAGTLQPANCVFLSYGKALDHLSFAELRRFLEELMKHGADGMWAALEIVSMYQLGRPTLDANLETIIKQLLSTPVLLEGVNRKDRDGFVFESLVGLVAGKGTLDADFAAALAEQFARLCQTEDYDIFTALDGSFRNVIALLVEKKPVELWEPLSRFYERAGSLERDWLERLVGPSEHGENQHTEGLLFNIPEEHLFSWAKADPANRAAFLCTFYPTLVKDKTGVYAWHDAFQRLANEFGGGEEFRHTLAGRLRPSSWWGSIVPFLEVNLQPLETWFAHRIPALAQWARETHSFLERRIAIERKRDEEDH